MMKATQTYIGTILCGCVWFLLSAILAAPSAWGDENSIQYARTDLRVLYVYDSPEQIDWPTLLYLNDRHGVRIDLVRFREAGAFYLIEDAIDNRFIYAHEVYLPTDQSAGVDSAFTVLFSERRPDIVLIGPVSSSSMGEEAGRYLRRMEPDRASLFNIVRVYEHRAPAAGETTDSAVTVSTAGLFRTYRDRIELEIPRLFGGFSITTYNPGSLSRYKLVRADDPQAVRASDFVDGLPGLRLQTVIDSLLSDSRVSDALTNRARQFLSYFSSALSMSGKPRVEAIIRGYKELVQLQYQARTQNDLKATPGFIPYVNRLVKTEVSRRSRGTWP